MAGEHLSSPWAAFSMTPTRSSKDASLLTYPSAPASMPARTSSSASVIPSATTADCGDKRLTSRMVTWLSVVAISTMTTLGANS